MTAKTASKKRLPKEHFSRMGHIRWRKERGIKLVASIVTMESGKKRATCVFEGVTYAVTAKTNIQALNNLFDVIKAKAELDKELN